MQGSLTSVVFHHIGVETDFERGLDVTTAFELFERQISRLNQDYDIIDLDTILSGNVPKRGLLITFDDCYKSAFQAIQQVLFPKRFPSIFFINPELLGQHEISLDSTLAWCVQKAGMAEVCSAINVQKKDNLCVLINQIMSNYMSCQRAQLKKELLERFGPVDFSSRNAVLEPEDLARLPQLGVEIGNHTATHVHCRGLSSNECYNELVASKKRLENLSRAKVRAFSVPYGDERDLTPLVLKTLRRHGHEAIFLAQARSNLFRPSNDIWDRVGLSQEEPSEFFLKLKIFPVIRSLLRLGISKRKRGP